MSIIKIDGKDIEVIVLQNNENYCSEEECCIQLKIKKCFLKNFIFNLLFANNNNNSEQIFLTKREKQVLEYISSGINNAQIAQKLNVSVHTTKVHIHNIFNKLSAQDRTEAVVKAIKYGLITFPKDFQDNEF